MNQNEAIKYLHSLQAFGMRPGLERMRALCAMLGNPQEHTKFVHVAGTNGKGSTCVMLESVLRKGGYKTGLFISPYVYDFCERIQINGVPVKGEVLASAINKVREAIGQMPHDLLPVTEFEALTAAAFLIYKEQACDIVVLETGLGGRLDSTNVIPPPLAAILTSISYDHMDVLGDTIEQIAAEKCGILKGGTEPFSGVAVIYPEQIPEALQTIREYAAKTNTHLVFPNMAGISEIQANCYGTEVAIHNSQFTIHNLHIPLLGEHMIKNAAVVLETVCVLRKLGYNISESAITDGIANAKIPARMEVREIGGVITLTDGGHNSGCGVALASALERHFTGWHIETICGMMADKDTVGYLSALAPHIQNLTAVTLPPPRGRKAKTLAQAAQSLGINCDVIENPIEAYSTVIKRLNGKKNALLLVCGSFVLAGRVR